MTPLRERFDAYQSANPRVRQRDAADALGVSEAELVAVRDGVVPLRPEWPALLGALAELPRVMALTRNACAVSEIRGAYGRLDLGTHGVGGIYGDPIDLRIFLHRWRYGFSVPGEHGPSLQFYDAGGTAVHKVFSEGPIDELAARFAAPSEPVEPTAAAPPAERSDAEIDAAELRARWDRMQDTHEVYGLLRDLGTTRTQAMRLLGPEHAQRLAPGALEKILRSVSDHGTAIMIFVGNPGCVQIKSGVVQKIVRAGDWINVMDPGFNLHVHEPKIASTWRVHKPTRAGRVSSLELYDEAGRELLYLFRKRADRDLPEDAGWSSLLAELPEA